MYLDIGNEIVLDTGNIIGILDIGKYKKNERDSYIENLKEIGQYMDVDMRGLSIKSLIISCCHGKTEIYPSSFSTANLGKRVI